MILNDPLANCEASVQDTIDWLRTAMSATGVSRVIVSREWARRLEIEGFDMELIEVYEPLIYRDATAFSHNEHRGNGPRGRWGGLR